ncbi:MAG: hypothetical protein WAL26_29685, partial [Mycobacterium sp.]
MFQFAGREILGSVENPSVFTCAGVASRPPGLGTRRTETAMGLFNKAKQAAQGMVNVQGAGP